jgi:AbrB family looped-hinge helix DNA binding protein
MPLATINSRGQVTIPKEIRDRLELRAGDQLDFAILGDGSVGVRKRALRVDDVFGAFAHLVDSPVSLEEMDTVVARSAVWRRRRPS